jgi:type IV pilus assembly protein PilM
MHLFYRQSPSLLGIDISSSAVKLLELSRKRGQVWVESYAVEPLPLDIVAESKIKDVEILGEAIKRAVKRAGARAKKAVAAVAGSAVITKVISVPAALSEREMESHIELEAEQYIPYPLEEVNLDFQVLDPTEENAEMREVLMAACRSETVDARVAALELAGLKPIVMDVESYALENVFPLLAKQIGTAGGEAIIALVDMGATSTSLNVLQHSKIVYTREQVFGGRQLTEEIQRRYNLSYEEADLGKRQGGLPDSYLTEILDPFKQVIAQQVGRAFQFFFSSTHYECVDQVILAGGCASIPGMDALIARAVGAPVLIANPFSNLALGSRIKVKALSSDAPALVIACGLALRSLNE